MATIVLLGSVGTAAFCCSGANGPSGQRKMASIAANPSLETSCISQGLIFAVPGIEGAIAGISGSDAPILIVGESGTGKDFLAEQIHRLSPQALRPFVKVPCATAGEGKLSQYVDHLTGASSDQEPQTIGTLFLEDVADLDGASQAQLLVALRENVARPKDRGRNSHPARLICSTRHNLEEGLARFNEELCHRISGVCLRIPPLRHRREDIGVLLNHFVAKYSTEMGQIQPKPTSRLLARMESYSWPGNVRELKHVAYQLAVAGDAIEDAPLGLFGEALSPDSSAKDGASVSLKDAAREASRRAERTLILKTLTRTGWNRKRAAQELRISYKALLYKLKDISLEESARQG